MYNVFVFEFRSILYMSQGKPCYHMIYLDWIFQVTRMLTGGFDVIGLFACASPDEWKSAQVKLRQVYSYN